MRPRTVTGDGEGLVSRGGLVWLGEVADRSGLTAGLSQVLAGAPRRRHDPGVGLAQLVVALADGAECLSDLDALRGQPQLFGPVPSRSNVQRVFRALGPAELRRLAGARAQARAAAWEAGAGPDGNEAIIDLDATIVRVITLAAAIDQLPGEWQAGHLAGDDPALAVKTLLVRTDSAGASHWFAEECRARNIAFSLGYWIDGRVRDALLLVQEEDWEPARLVSWPTAVRHGARGGGGPECGPV